MSRKDIIVIGSSAGGVDALRRLCGSLPASLPAAVFIAQHLSPSGRSVLPEILSKASLLPAIAPRDGQKFEMGHIYVAAPDHHLLLREDAVLMRRGPLENSTRPSANALFRSAALAYGARVIGVVLTGLLDDGTEGLIAIKAAGGTSVVQHPDDAEWPSMPRNAIARDHVDHAVPLDELGALLVRLTQEDAGPSVPLPEEFGTEDRIAAQSFAMVQSVLTTPGSASPYSCPDCGGVLNQIDTDDEDTRFRCQIGHAFTSLGLVAAQNGEVERALGVAVRTHRDRIRLFDQLTRNALGRNMKHAAERWRAATVESSEMIHVLEQAMAHLRKPSTDA